MIGLAAVLALALTAARGGPPKNFPIKGIRLNSLRSTLRINVENPPSSTVPTPSR